MTPTLVCLTYMLFDSAAGATPGEEGAPAAIWNLKPWLNPQWKPDEQRNPQLPTSVPMPSAVEDITNAGMRAMWEEADGSEVAAPAAVEPLN